MRHQDKNNTHLTVTNVICIIRQICHHGITDD